jgi:hypothetical protein
MKLLQAFKSFLTGDSIIENRQRKLVRCRPHNSAAKTGSLQAAQFSNENWFATGTLISTVNSYFVAANTLSAANANSLHATQFQQRIAISLQSIHFRQRTLIHCRTTQLPQ